MFHPALRVNIGIQKDPIINNDVVIMRSPDDTINDIRIHWHMTFEMFKPVW